LDDCLDNVFFHNLSIKVRAPHPFRAPQSRLSLPGRRCSERQLAEFIHTQDPAARGWSYRTIYKMVQLYDTYSTSSFASLLAETDMKAYKDIVPFETAQKIGGTGF